MVAEAESKLQSQLKGKSSGKLAAFLRTSKAKFLETRDVKGADHGHEQWTVVMGNESADLDSIASSIGYAWVQSNLRNKPTIPLIQLYRADFHLRAENVHALSLAGLSSSTQSSFPELLSLDDLPPPSADTPFPAPSVALVDHNRLLSPFASHTPAPAVTAIIDHHADEGSHTDGASPRVVQPAGSCSSLVTTVLAPERLPPELATLLLSAIVIDTHALKEGGKAGKVDYDAAAFLLPKSTLATSLDQQILNSVEGGHGGRDEAIRSSDALSTLSDNLSSLKSSVSHLSIYDLLRRDYKQYTFSLSTQASVKIETGLSSVPIGLRDLASRAPGDGEEGLWGAVQRWMDERSLLVLGILTSFRDTAHPKASGKPKHRREMLLVVRNSPAEAAVAAPELDASDLARCLFGGLEASEELDAKRADMSALGITDLPEKTWVTRAYQQRNANATRKTVAPVVREILEGYGKGKAAL